VIVLKFILDRFEGDYAVLEKEEGGTIDVLKEKVNGAREGDVLLFENGKYTVSEEETHIRKKRIEEKMRKLFK